MIWFAFVLFGVLIYVGLKIVEERAKIRQEERRVMDIRRRK